MIGNHIRLRENDDLHLAHKEKDHVLMHVLITLKFCAVRMHNALQFLVLSILFFYQSSRG